MQSNSNSSKQSNETLTKVSVVMSVYDQPGQVKQTIASVLAQKGVELEFVIVDDGADNAVKSEINQYKTDRRFVLIEQENQGLTKALIKGCKRSSHDYIARIDVGDTMSVNRLHIQSRLLDENDDIGLVSSWVSIQTVEGYHLYDVKHDAIDLQSAVTSIDAETIKTPIHASVMMRKSIYQQAGGYRPEFYFAQDCDLWARMSSLCQFAVVPQILTHGIFSHFGISGRYKSAQSNLTKLIAESNRLRQKGDNESQILEKARTIRPVEFDANDDSKLSEFPSLYFIARCLSRNRSRYAKNIGAAQLQKNLGAFFLG